MLEVSLGVPAPRKPPLPPHPEPKNLSLTEGVENGVPVHWTSRARRYDLSVENGVLRIDPKKQRADHAFISQTVEAKPFIGAKVRLSADLATDCEEESFGALFLSVSNAERMIAYDNMQDRPVRGERDFQTESVILEVPAEAEEISFAIWVAGNGILRAKNIQLTREE
jgi:hypothetical protein